ncbi:MAG: dihydrolipoamide acetyltransferase family protein [Candidatus Hydrogenedentales bacterium]|jgi:pyruvate dehydrogenase E2 component (dihydrolipoamide acetyltransferase)
MQEILLPKMGNSVEEAEIITWYKQEGDAVALGEPLFSIQTDKAEVDCESTASGVLRKILVPEGVEVPVLTVVALVGDSSEALPDLSRYAKAAPSAAVSVRKDALSSAQPAAAAAPASDTEDTSIVSGPLSPRARKAALRHHIDTGGIVGSGVGGRIMEGDVLAAGAAMSALSKSTPTARRMLENAGLSAAGIRGTGVGGKITKEDVNAAVASAAGAAAGDSTTAKRVPLSPMRRIIAERMCNSKYSAPHYYVTVEVDMAAAKRFRGQLTSFKASYNDLVLFAVARALREFPQVNARWETDSIVEGGDVNLGMAVALNTGLMVPVIRQAQLLSLEGLCAATRVLAEKAQTGKLLPDDYQGNSFTVSNLGAFGVDHFTAIINQPDSAILAVGQMKDRVVVIDRGIHIRPIMKLTLSSDHRVVDGAAAAKFMGRLKEILEEAAF